MTGFAKDHLENERETIELDMYYQTSPYNFCTKPVKTFVFIFLFFVFWVMFTGKLEYG